MSPYIRMYFPPYKCLVINQMQRSQRRSKHGSYMERGGTAHIRSFQHSLKYLQVGVSFLLILKAHNTMCSLEITPFALTRKWKSTITNKQEDCLVCNLVLKFIQTKEASISVCSTLQEIEWSSKQTTGSVDNSFLLNPVKMFLFHKEKRPVLS